MDLIALTALSPVDGRYRRKVAELAQYMSEYALIKYRVIVEVIYLIHLSETPLSGVRSFSSDERVRLNELMNVTPDHAQIIKDIETKGYLDIKKTNHDVVAVVEYLKMRLKDTSLNDVIPWIHIARTSEDINNLAYALMLRDAIHQVIVPRIDRLRHNLFLFGNLNVYVAMLSRTHGQAATPTTLGKEIRVFAVRLERQLDQLKAYKLSVKCNGAVGNYAADMKAFPKIPYKVALMDTFIRRVTEYGGYPDDSFRINYHTTQIEPHDTYAELFGIIMRLNTILIDFCQDIWRYISDDWLVQTPIEGEVGSSAMPHKVNPIDFENAEGNLGVANANLEHYCRKLPISRLQRDLSDSTVERGFGMTLGFSLVSYLSIIAGLEKISPNEEKIAEALESHPEILAEAIQTIIRRAGVSGGYDIMKELSRGKKVTLKDLHEHIRGMKNLPQSVRSELLALKPSEYIGLSTELVEEY